MKLIADIRLYLCDVPDAEGRPTPRAFSRELNLKVRRIAMKLRELGCSLGDYDHLYLHFTPNPGPQRPPDRYTPWLLRQDVAIGSYALSEGEALELLGQELQKRFPEVDLSAVFAQAELGEAMEMRFKEKRSANRHGVVFLRLRNNAHYWPLVRVYDGAGKCLLERDLPETVDLSTMGELQLSRKKITIKPRKNAFSGHLQPITFEIPEEPPC